MRLHIRPYVVQTGSRRIDGRLDREVSRAMSTGPRRVARRTCVRPEEHAVAEPHHPLRRFPVAIFATLLVSLTIPVISPTLVASASQQVAQGTPDGVIPIDAEDEDSVLSNLLNEAMSYISGGSSADSGPTGTQMLDNGSELLGKLRQEQDRLKQKAAEEEAQKKEREAARLEAMEKAKAEAEQKKAQEDERRRVEAARKAAEEEAMKKIREEEATKRAREIDARKEAERREKEEREMRLHAERERQESERLRQVEGAQRRRDQVLAAAGGASVGVIVSIAGEVFRSIGGPTIIAMALRTPGVVVGKQFRVVEWDIKSSPREPDGACVTINIRATQLNPKGLRTEIAKMYRLENSKQVKQFRHCYMFGTIIFYEQLDSPQAISKLEEGGVIVWTRVSPSTLVMPSRNDRLPSHTEAGMKVEAVSQRAEETASKYIRRVATATALICRWSRGEFEPDVDVKAVQATLPEGGSATPFTDNGAGQHQGKGDVGIARRHGQADAEAAKHHVTADADVGLTTPPLSCEWLLSASLAAEAQQHPEVQEQLRQLDAISLAEEGRIIACIFNSDKVVLDLFEAFAHASIFRFVAYSQAHVGRGLNGTD